MPYIIQVAASKRVEMGVFGNDYSTHEGIVVGDYIHIVDLANGHVAALKAIENKCGVSIYVQAAVIVSLIWYMLLLKSIELRCLIVLNNVE